ncbi:hypothetical protein AMS68_004845 [Peltaster fructicola]|uniref:Pali-domain-containing protein n=1 Tax=Peltaster fructicola TaxID=286661 RepID=A0A6H0XXK6_9PEZI|nr:hypothetical protein AMS68_004845 [Peltaster fructicola]
MLLRPATPLSVILIIAFALLLLSTLSTPIIKAIPLAVDQGWEFGVFGYCSTSGTNCISPHIGYSTDQLFNGDSGDFSLPSTSRHSLSYILIVHPIAALLTLICAILALAAHFHTPASSARYLLALLVLTIPTLLASLLAFLVDILLFVPHMAWGGWIVLAATVLIVASSVLTCAMRRTLVSRKARTKRIAENDDMNGTTYYNTLNQNRMMADTLPQAESPPAIPTYGADKAGSQYGSFEMKSHPRTSEDRAPLNPMREGSVRSASTGAGAGRPYGNENELPPMPLNTTTRRPSRDEYISPVSPISPLEMGIPPLRPSGSRGSLNSNGSNRGMPYRGRGGYGPPQRGFGPGRGGYGPPRGGYGPTQRGSYGPRGGYRGGPPPPGFIGRGGYGQQGLTRGQSPGGHGQALRGQSPAGYGQPPRGQSPAGYGQSPRGQSPAGYGQNSPGQSPIIDPYYSRNTPSALDNRPPPSVDEHFIARGASPGLDAGIGQAIEMDERTGSPPAHYHSQNYIEPERNTSASPVRRMSPDRQDAGPMYSDDAYVSPRTEWKPALHPNAPSRFMPDNASSNYSRGGLSPIQASPPMAHDNIPGVAHHARAGSEPYYEDVDPRFAVEEPSIDQHINTMPNVLMPGNAFNSNSAPIRR